VDLQMVRLMARSIKRIVPSQVPAQRGAIFLSGRWNL
jgi:uncharacterized membrane protein